MKRVVWIVSALFMCMYQGCLRFENPYDPDQREPLPLYPSAISVSSDNSDTVAISFAYDYAGGSQIWISRDDSVIVKMNRGFTYHDFWGLIEDRTYIYSVAGKNDHGISAAQPVTVDYFLAPRITVTVLDDTTSPGSLIISGTVTDRSGVESFSVNGAGIDLGPGGTWSHTVGLKPGLNTVVLLARDRSSRRATATMEVKVIR